MLYELGLINVITLKESIEKAKNTVNSKILNVYDCGDRWISDFEFEVNATTSVIFCRFVWAVVPSLSKTTGKRVSKVGGNRVKVPAPMTYSQ